MKLLNQRRLPNGAKIQMRQMGATYCVEAKLPRQQIQESLEFRTFRRRTSHCLMVRFSGGFATTYKPHSL
jgi:hypothetical protein